MGNLLRDIFDPNSEYNKQIRKRLENIEREKIDKAIEEMKALANPENTILGFDEKWGVNDCYEYFSKKYRRVNYG